MPAPPANRRLLTVLFAGVLMGALDIAIVGPALPAMGQEFGLDSRALSWVFNVYVLFHLFGAPLLSKLSDRHGRRRIFIGSLTTFAAGSLVVALAPSFELVLGGRAIQAFGAGGIFPIASAVIGDSFPAERRGRALGMLGAVFGLAFLLGPVLGGVLLRWHWQWLFWINLPIAAVVIWQSAKLLPHTASSAPRPFDLFGATLLIAFLAALVLGLSRIDATAPGAALLSVQVLPFLVTAALVLPVFWRVERRAQDPVLDPVLFGSRQLRVVGVIALATGVTEAAMVFLPTVAVHGLGVDAATASLMMLPLVSTLIVGAPIAGHLLVPVGPKRLIQAGLMLTAAGLAVFALPDLTKPTFFAAGIGIGLGLSGLLGAPLRYIVLQEAGESRRGAGQGLLTLCLGAGRLIGAAVVGAVAVVAAAGSVAGYQRALLTVAALIAAVLMLSVLLNDDRGLVGAQRAG